MLICEIRTTLERNFVVEAKLLLANVKEKLHFPSNRRQARSNIRISSAGSIEEHLVLLQSLQYKKGKTLKLQSKSEECRWKIKEIKYDGN